MELILSETTRLKTFLINTRRMMFLSLLFISLFVACGPIVPATVPAQLSQTAGPPVVITERTYTSIAFELTYPDGWRVISSPANAAPWVVLTSPDGQAVITIGVDAADTEVSPPGVDDAATPQHVAESVFFQDGTSITAAFSADSAVYDDLLPTFERVVQSLQPPVD